MNQFAEAAKIAVKFYLKHTVATPLEAWQKAINELSDSTWVRKKTCPKNTFLGLASDGYISGIPAKNYTNSVERIYARKAVEILKKTPSLAACPSKLWSEIGNSGKSCDSQMEIVVALWKERIIK